MPPLGAVAAPRLRVAKLASRNDCSREPVTQILPGNVEMNDRPEAYWLRITPNCTRPGLLEDAPEPQAVWDALVCLEETDRNGVWSSAGAPKTSS